MNSVRWLTGILTVAYCWPTVDTFAQGYASEEAVKRSTVSVGVAADLVVLATAADSAAMDVQFNRDIRPILSDNGFQCHGPDANSREADLRLDEPKDAVADRGGRFCQSRSSSHPMSIPIGSKIQLIGLFSASINRED